MAQQEIERDRSNSELDREFIDTSAITEKPIRQSQGHRDPQRHRRSQPSHTTDRVRIVIASHEDPLCPSTEKNALIGTAAAVDVCAVT
ncbi:hypothetical protein AB0E01_30320 [Nocardia vinacea]|uniref:hypothetical protein n=1 Tax=Nocardia vinacea TaxID=96468 RepID=UPI0033D8F598